MLDRKKSRLSRRPTWDDKIIFRRLKWTFIATRFPAVESFSSCPPNFPKPLNVNEINQARINKALYLSRFGDAPSSWHILPDNAATRTEEDSILHGCDAIVTTITTTDISLRQHRWVHSLDHATSSKITSYTDDEQSMFDQSTYPPKEALAAIEATHRWASKFVRPLHLCPWAGSSLDTKGAIRYWVLLVDCNDNGGKSCDELGRIHREEQCSRVFEHMDRIVRAAGRQLELITTEAPASCKEGSLSDNKHELNSIDASVAISFVIIVPTRSNISAASPSQSWENSIDVLPDFESFHDNFLDLEDRLLDECDEYWDVTDNNNMEIMVPDGCKITIAAFHPQWKFNNKDDLTADENDIDTKDCISPVDFEKRTPYPTISIVLSSAIDAFITKEEQENNSSNFVTERIAALNERTLHKIGLDKLISMFEAEVVCPVRILELGD